MSTATLAPSPIRRHTATPVRPAPAALPSRIGEPHGLAEWRLAAAGRERQSPPQLGQVRKVLDAVRSGASLASAARRAKLPQRAVLDVVVGVGSRMSQANKKGPKADRCLSLSEAAAAGVAGTGAVEVAGALVVVLGEGWERTAAHGRDIGRAYAAIVLADPAGDDRPIGRWLGTLASEQEVTYATYAHLMAVATGKLHTFTGLTEDADVQEAYLRAFDMVADDVATASAGIGRLCRADLDPKMVLATLAVCFWMVPDASRLANLARHAAAGDPIAASRLRVALGNLRAAVGRKPAKFFPRSLADLSARQYRTILARRGFHPADMADAARSETDFTDIGSALAAIRERLNTGVSLEEAAEEVTRLAASWHGLDA